MEAAFCRAERTRPCVVIDAQPHQVSRTARSAFGKPSSAFHAAHERAHDHTALVSGGCRGSPQRLRPARADVLTPHHHHPSPSARTPLIGSGAAQQGHASAAAARWALARRLDSALGGVHRAPRRGASSPSSRFRWPRRPLVMMGVRRGGRAGGGRSGGGGGGSGAECARPLLQLLVSVGVTRSRRWSRSTLGAGRWERCS
jgi:hypothetical protein